MNVRRGPVLVLLAIGLLSAASSAAGAGEESNSSANEGVPVHEGDGPDEPQTAGLPKVVLVGDSIRLSYAAGVAEKLEGQAVVVGPKANGGDSANVLKHLGEWVVRERPDVVHFNCGIHDTKRFQATKEFQVSPEQYAANLRRIVERVRRETGAVVLFATTTPVLDDRAARARSGRDYELTGRAVEQYNAVAKEVMRELMVPVNDLHAAIAGPERPLRTETLIGGDGVHLTATGRELLGQQVATFVGRHLPRRQDQQE